ncbi:MAG: ATP synthase subunit delta [Parcubacteria group bacterium GW2011_GWC1_35_8]|uniref:ATP synthase subunit delta n=3 Tax=Candidatus Nomuraibacteriota TaxID=1752729 RepID=A0A1F6YWM1_9BACT|nr:MAG: ATP synthase subunit delta [Parcubacteria group bacterium GW2011_GWC1_35_8]KKP89594.1 MAG: ATP synthase subunit delta [Candidatus Nomurabacteria bacterium GW2011_GWC2_35_8]OGJ04741.1 MAG: ATP synthase F1 subunit delta [Candidatus Nomurabacteria bacterium RIFOXYA2_FULL_35_9]OGJ06607.1 MAG: ATP synthase F1 subunit delta [Candidatus Nomurabacteria bacterium RIFOXYA1_FULL_35_17]OGJ10757.1 MAG: ATP synthase F1 subunit delta [Candidatus Nomurabacteria bacterium RIFOXYC2_FULL_36_19]OGJ13950.1
MTTTSNNDIARAIYLMFKDKSSSEQKNISEKVVKFLFRRRLLSKAPDILSRLKKIINNADGRLEVKISSVEALSHQVKTHLEQTLKKRYLVKEVVLKEYIDKKLLGGLKIEVNDEVIDLSIKNKIEKLQEYLIKV